MAFLFCLTNVETKDLLKIEMKERYPDWRLAFSGKDFVTFKNDKKVKIWPNPFFARLSGESLKGQESLIEPDFQYENEVDDLWPVKFHHSFSLFNSKNEVTTIKLPADAASRAWLKMAEAFELLQLPLVENQLILEWGAAPGGISQYLLSKGCKVLGVDKAQMAPEVLSQKKFRYAEGTIFDEKIWSKKFDWLVCDVNLDPDTVLKQVFKFLERHQETSGVYITLKMTKIIYVKKLVDYLKKFQQLGFFPHYQLLPSHKKEILLWATRTKHS